MADLSDTLRHYDLLTLVERDVQLKRVAVGKDGEEYAGPCPFCGGTDRFRVWPHHRSGRGRWYCRECQRRGEKAAGDAVTYLERKGMGFREAVESLGVRLDELPRRRVALPEATPPLPEATPPGREWQDRAWAFVKYAQECLFDEHRQAVRNYLAKERGLSEKTITGACIGFNPKDMYDRPHKWGLDDEHRVYLSLGVVIPWELEGTLWYVNVRRPLAGDALHQAVCELAGFLPEVKYRAVRGGQGRAVFGQLGQREALLVVEGEFDALLAIQEAGDLADVIAVGGSSKGNNGLAGRWLLRMARYRRIFVALDADKAGRNGAARLLGQDRRGIDVCVPRGNDLTGYWQAGGDVRALIGGWVFD
jgi:ribosomal protein L37AE/L43A